MQPMKKSANQPPSSRRRSRASSDDAPGQTTAKLTQPSLLSSILPSVPVSASSPRDRQLARSEAARYADPIASRETIMALLDTCEGPLAIQEIAQQLDLVDRLAVLERRLQAMVRDGQLVQNRRGEYAPVCQTNLIAGRVIANPDGFGFLRPDDPGDDLFLPPFEMRKVMHGDRILANVTGVDRRGRRQGAVARILERGRQRLVGYFFYEFGVAYVQPEDKRLMRNVQIPGHATGGAREGQLVVCELVAPPDARRPAIGQIIAVLGDKLEPSLVVQTAIYGHEIADQFSAEVVAEAAALPQTVSRADCRDRVDLRQVPLMTIDGEDAQDFDDAVFCRRSRDGFQLIVAIADVAHYVALGSRLDHEALHRATSVYFPGFVVPMLPEALSHGICSLNPHVDRLCLACDMQVDDQGQVKQARFYEAVMHSHARLTYDQAWEALQDPQGQAAVSLGSQLAHLQCLHQLYQRFADARTRRGAIEFTSSQTRFSLGRHGEVILQGMEDRHDAHKIIEECMIAANVCAARLMLDAAMTVPFRIHERPPQGKYEELLAFLTEFGLSMPPWATVSSKDFMELFQVIRDRPDATLIEPVLLRTQSLAVYATENRGHFGLALQAYAHVTSPIRRYPDLLLHRAIKHGIHHGDSSSFAIEPAAMTAAALHCSQQERKAEEAEREVDERLRAAWMANHLGQEFAGVIVGVTGFGLFVESNPAKVTGLIHVTQLPHDYYHFDPIRKTLQGERHRRLYRLGDRVQVKLLKASLVERKIDFSLIAHQPA